MNKYIALGALVLASLTITASAFAASTYNRDLPRGVRIAVIEENPATEVYKVKDGGVVCYVAYVKAGMTQSTGLTMSCLK